MNFRKLGRTGLKVSEVGFGAWAIGGTSWGPTDDNESLKAIQGALELGVNFIDTADSYGNGHSEQLICKALEGRRDECIIATKVGNDFYNKSGTRKNFDPNHIFFAVEQSLKRLKTDVVDIYQLHSPKTEIIKNGEAFEALDKLKKQGKIRFYGVSVVTPEDGIAAINTGKPDVIQVIFNILDQKAEADLFPLARKNNVGIIARVPLAYGMLTGKFTPETAFPKNDHRRGRWTREVFKTELKKVDKLRFLVEGNDRTMAQAALKFVLCSDAVSVTIPGAKSAAQVQDNIGSVNGGYLSQDDLDKIKELYENTFNARVQ